MFSFLWENPTSHTHTPLLRYVVWIGLKGLCCRCSHLLTGSTAAKDLNCLSLNRLNLGTCVKDNSTRDREDMGWTREGIKTAKQTGYEKQIAKHKHQSVDRSRNRKLDSQELENASMREKWVSMIHCVSPATVGWGIKEWDEWGRKKKRIEKWTWKAWKRQDRERKQSNSDLRKSDQERHPRPQGLFTALPDTTGASVLALGASFLLILRVRMWMGYCFFS